MTAGRFLPSALLVGLTVVAAACAQTQAGQPSVERASSGARPAQLAPPVINPKDAQGVTPCGVLNPQQLTQLGLDPSTQELASSVGLSTCRWRDVKTLFEVSVTVDTNASRGGLNDTYLKKDGFAVFQPTAINGYPAVHADESTRPGGCTYFVGISDTQAFFVRSSADVNKISDPCQLARRASADVLQNLPPLR